MPVCFPPLRPFDRSRWQLSPRLGVLEGCVAAKFGRKDDDKQEKIEQWRFAMQAEFERLSALPLVELATQVMVRGFGPGGPGGDDAAVTLGQANVGADPTAEHITFEFVPDRGFTFPLPAPEDFKLRERLARLVSEGLQELEHASLVRFQMHTSMGSLDWAATRHGRAALEGGEVQSILQRRSALG
jgi:hypothetical protein